MSRVTLSLPFQGVGYSSVRSVSTCLIFHLLNAFLRHGNSYRKLRRIAILQKTREANKFSGGASSAGERECRHKYMPTELQKLAFFISLFC